MPRLGVGSRRVRARAPLVDEGLPEDGPGTGPHPSRRVARRGWQGSRAEHAGNVLLSTFTTAEAAPQHLVEIRVLLKGLFESFSSDDWDHTLGGWHVVLTEEGSCSRTQPSSLACSWWPGAPIGPARSRVWAPWAPSG